MANTRYKENTRKRTNKIETKSKGIVWYDDVDHLRKRIKAETKWLVDLTMKEEIDPAKVIKQSNFVKELVDYMADVIANSK